jgi:hypothetical protein
MSESTAARNRAIGPVRPSEKRAADNALRELTHHGRRQLSDAARAILAEHWDVIQDEATRAESKSGNPMFGISFPA